MEAQAADLLILMDLEDSRLTSLIIIDLLIEVLIEDIDGITGRHMEIHILNGEMIQKWSLISPVQLKETLLVSFTIKTLAS